jgi:hypothetical protein
MADKWVTVCTAKQTAWNIPQSDLTNLTSVRDLARLALEAATNESTRTPVTIARCKTMFGQLTEFMRYFKRHYFLSPPLTEADFVSLGLRPPDPHPTPVPPPKTAPLFSIDQTGPGALGIVFRNGEEGKKGSKPDGVEGARIYYGFEPVTDQRQLPFSEWATKCPHVFRFPEADRGKRVYFALQWEIRKEHGESPWSEIQSELIP